MLSKVAKKKNDNNNIKKKKYNEFTSYTLYIINLRRLLRMADFLNNFLPTIYIRLELSVI